MPDKTPRTKAEKASAVTTVMKEFGSGKLHSGSKSGPVVKNPAQAKAIAMSESGQSKKGPPSDKTKAPPSNTSPDFYKDTSRPKAKVADKTITQDASLGNAPPKMVPPNPGVMKSVVPPLPPAGKPPFGASHGYGHGATQRSGHLRLSGNSGAHHIGKRGK